MRYIFIFLFLYSCCPKITTTITETKEVHDTTTITILDKTIDTIIDSDTLTQTIVIECDSNGKASIKETNKKGKRNGVNTSIKNNVISNIFYCDSLQIQINYKDSIINSLRSEKTLKQTTNNIIEYRMPFWGWLLIGAALAFALYSRFVK